MVVISPFLQQFGPLPLVSTTEFLYRPEKQIIEMADCRWECQDPVDEPFRRTIDQPQHARDSIRCSHHARSYQGHQAFRISSSLG